MSGRTDYPFVPDDTPNGRWADLRAELEEARATIAAMEIIRDSTPRLLDQTANALVKERAVSDQLAEALICRIPTGWIARPEDKDAHSALAAHRALRQGSPAPTEVPTSNLDDCTALGWCGDGHDPAGCPVCGGTGFVARRAPTEGDPDAG